MTSKLDIINHLLGVVGELPVTSEDSNHPTVLSAVVQIDRVSKELQQRGWWFNTEYNLPLSPNESGHIVLPSNTLSVEALGNHKHLVRRGGKLYDPIKHTYNIGTAVNADVILLLTIAELPETAAAFITHQTSYDFYVNDDGDETKSNRLEKNITTAWAKFRQEEFRVTGVNAKDRPAFIHLKHRMNQQGNQYNPRYPGGTPI